MFNIYWRVSCGAFWFRNPKAIGIDKFKAIKIHCEIPEVRAACHEHFQPKSPKNASIASIRFNGCCFLSIEINKFNSFFLPLLPNLEIRLNHKLHVVFGCNVLFMYADKKGLNPPSEYNIRFQICKKNQSSNMA